jgi:hypothetical protein
MINKNLQIFNKGLNTDIDPLFQPEGTYRYALNGIVSNETNMMFANEGSNYFVDKITVGYSIIGDIYIGDDVVILFSCNDTHSEIGRLDKAGIYTVLVNTPDLNFVKSSSLIGTYRNKINGISSIYWVDGVNKPRSINLNNLDEYKDIGGNWDANKFDLIKTYESIPHFDSVEVLEDGNIKPGSYSFAIQLLDINLNPTGWITTSNTINIYNDKINNDFSKIRGSRNLSNQLMAYGNTSKSIRLTLSNFDSTYPYYRVAIIQSNTMTGIANKVLASEIRSINELTYVYSGNDETLTTTSLDDIAVNKEVFERVSCIEQLDNRLILANGSGKDVDYTLFQKYASKIRSHLVLKNTQLNDVTSKGNAKNPTSSFDTVGYMPGEVYSFGIVYIFNDGVESPVYHIPGRNTADVRAPISGFNDNLDYYQNSDSHYTNIHATTPNYWGSDCYGSALTGANQRFHKFPTRSSRSIPLYTKSGINYSANIFGIRFDNIEIPDSRVIAYYIVRNKKEDFDRHVVDTAIFGNTVEQVFGTVTYNVFNKWTSVVDGEYVNKDNTIGTVGSGFSQRDISNNTLYFYSPEYQFLNKINNFDHIDIYGVYDTTRKMTSVNGGEPPPTGNFNQRDYGIVIADAMAGTSFDPAIYQGGDNDGFNLLIGYRNINPDITTLANPITWSYDNAGASTIENVLYINATDNKVYSGKTYYNACQDNKIGMIKFSDDHLLFNNDTEKHAYFGSNPQFRPVYYGALIKDNTTSYANFIDRDYFKEHNNPIYFTGTVGNTLDIFNGDSYISALTPIASSYFDMKMADRMAKKKKTSGGILAVGLAIVGVALTIASFGVAIPFVTAGLTGVYALSAGIVGSALLSMSISAAVSTMAANLKLEALLQMVATDYPTGLQATISDLNMSELATVSNPYGCGLINGTASTDDCINVFSDRLTNVFLESSINISLRTALTSVATDFIGSLNSTLNTFNLSFSTFTHGTVNLDGYDDEEFRGYLTSKWTIIDTENLDGRLYKGYAGAEWHDVNPDFKRLNEQKLFIYLPINYAKPTLGVSQYPNRVWYSEQGSQDEIIDNYQSFLTNNYKDIEQELGDVSYLFRISTGSIDNLFIQTEFGLWKQPKNLQEKVTSDLVTYIGTGEFLALPPLKVNNTIGGLRYSTAGIMIEHGWVFVDDTNKCVYLFDGEKLNNISSVGMAGFFIENLKNYLLDQTLDLGYDLFDTPIDNLSIILGYDKNNGRILLTKNDYQIISSTNFKGIYDTGVTYAVNNIVLHDSNFYIINTITPTVTKTKLELPDSNYFINKSYTVSYSFKSSSWTSFHSYLPTVYISTPNNLYSLQENNIPKLERIRQSFDYGSVAEITEHCIDNGYITDPVTLISMYGTLGRADVRYSLYRHNKQGSYGVFYETECPFIVETVSNEAASENKTWRYLELTVNSRKYDSVNNYYYDVNHVFDQAILYNLRQCSGLIVLNKNSNKEFDYIQESNESLVSNKENVWRINNIRNYLNTSGIPMFTKSWDNVKYDYPIDKLINDDAIDLNKDWNSIDMLRDKYMIIRLINTNIDTDINMVVSYIGEQDKLSLR